MIWIYFKHWLDFLGISFNNKIDKKMKTWFLKTIFEKIVEQYLKYKSPCKWRTKKYDRFKYGHNMSLSLFLGHLSPMTQSKDFLKKIGPFQIDMYYPLNSHRKLHLMNHFRKKLKSSYCKRASANLLQLTDALRMRKIIISSISCNSKCIEKFCNRSTSVSSVRINSLLGVMMWKVLRKCYQ